MKFYMAISDTTGLSSVKHTCLKQESNKARTTYIIVYNLPKPLVELLLLLSVYACSYENYKEQNHLTSNTMQGH